MWGEVISQCRGWRVQIPVARRGPASSPSGPQEDGAVRLDRYPAVSIAFLLSLALSEQCFGVGEGSVIGSSLQGGFQGLPSVSSHLLSPQPQERRAGVKHRRPRVSGKDTVMEE